MYRPAAFAVDDIATLHAFIRERAFATIATATDGLLQIAYAPAVLRAEEGTNGALRFHLARNNPVAMAAEGAQLLFSFLGPDSYISPDWYSSPGMVPTWNYIAAEGRGVARKLNGEELRRLLVDLSAEHEQKLQPKKPWTIDKVPQQRMDTLIGAIAGFEVRLETLCGKYKLSQNIKRDDFEGALHGLDARIDPEGSAVARAMRKTIAP